MPACPVAEVIEGGFLRPTVLTQLTDVSLDLSFSFWQLSIPLQYARSDPSLESFLFRRASIHSVTDSRKETRNLLSLIEAQGCISFKPSKVLPLTVVGKMFHSVIAEWYADYYSHPLWARLLNATITRHGLEAWILRTYYLSRSAGVTAARCAAICHIPHVREIFRRNSLEEFDHCERYYNVGALTSTAAQTVSSLAFDQQMLYMAEHDWLAHVFIAFFQENTAAFSKNAKQLYDKLATKFELGGYFQPWKQHIGYDISQCHAAEFAAVFESDETVTFDQYLPRALKMHGLRWHFSLAHWMRS